MKDQKILETLDQVAKKAATTEEKVNKMVEASSNNKTSFFSTNPAEAQGNKALVNNVAVVTKTESENAVRQVLGPAAAQQESIAPNKR